MIDSIDRQHTSGVGRPNGLCPRDGGKMEHAVFTVMLERVAREERVRWLDLTN